MRGILATLTIVLLAPLAGCGEEATESPERIIFTRGGGISGIGYNLAIEPDGSATIDVMAGLEDDHVDFDVPQDELTAITEHLESTGVGDLGETSTEDCFDCFAYSLEYGDELAAADSATVTDEFFAAIDPLEGLIEEHLPAAYEY